MTTPVFLIERWRRELPCHHEIRRLCDESRRALMQIKVGKIDVTNVS